MDKTLKVTLAQINPVVGDLKHNTAKIMEAWSGAPEDTDLIIFSELVVCGYPPEDLILKPFFMEQVRKSIEIITKGSAKLKPAALIGCPWGNDGKIYNAAHLIENGRIVETRVKQRLPNYDVFDEKRIFEVGPFPEPVKFRDHTLGVMICEDMWTADISDYLKNQGAEILIVMNASPFDIQNIQDRMKQAHKRAQETALPMIYVNQVGGQDELVFDGGSFVMNENAEIMHRLSQFEEDTATIAFPLTGQTGHSWPGGEEAIYKALVLGLRDYIAKNNFPGVLIGLSGGIDSALSAVIAADALGPDKVHCVMMPSQYTSQDSLDDAETLAKNIGVKLDTISIESPVEAFNDVLASTLTKDSPSTTFENIQPRSRGLILMALSNATGKMVLSTGNKSEMAVGYATLYGDMCGGFNVLKDLYKMQVYALSNWRNTQSHVIPERIITKAPTAELKDNQTDQDTLPPYEELDDILACLIEQDMGLDEITARGHSRETVAKTWKMLDRAEYKRRQAPPGIKITSRAFGRDRRYPITNHFVNIIEKSGS